MRAPWVRIEYSQRGAEVSQTDTDKAVVAEERTAEARSFVRRVRTATRRRYSAEEKIRIVLEGFRRETPVNDLCRREGIKPHSSYAWTKEFMEAGKERLARDTLRTPLNKRYRPSGERTESSSSWWASCPWRGTVSKNGHPDPPRRRRYQRMSRGEGRGTCQGSLLSSPQG